MSCCPPLPAGGLPLAPPPRWKRDRFTGTFTRFGRRLDNVTGHVIETLQVRAVADGRGTPVIDRLYVDCSPRLRAVIEPGTRVSFDAEHRYTPDGIPAWHGRVYHHFRQVSRVRVSLLQGGARNGN